MLTDVKNTADLAELERLYRVNVRRVYGFVVNRLGQSDAADITAEVFHAAAIATREGRISDVTTAWLFAVARNKIHDHWRRAYRRKAKAHLVAATEDDLTHFPPDWSTDPRRAEVIAALDQLSDRDRSLLVLHHVDGMSTGDLAEAADKSVAAIESALARARRRFRAVYQPASAGRMVGDTGGEEWRGPT